MLESSVKMPRVVMHMNSLSSRSFMFRNETLEGMDDRFPMSEPNISETIRLKELNDKKIQLDYLIDPNVSIHRKIEMIEAIEAKKEKKYVLDITAGGLLYDW